jgi:hypothetical protein
LSSLLLFTCILSKCFLIIYNHSPLIRSAHSLESLEASFRLYIYGIKTATFTILRENSRYIGEEGNAPLSAFDPRACQCSCYHFTVLWLSTNATLFKSYWCEAFPVPGHIVTETQSWRFSGLLLGSRGKIRRRLTERHKKCMVYV